MGKEVTNEKSSYFRKRKEIYLKALLLNFFFFLLIQPLFAEIPPLFPACSNKLAWEMDLGKMYAYQADSQFEILKGNTAKENLKGQVKIEGILNFRIIDFEQKQNVRHIFVAFQLSSLDVAVNGQASPAFKNLLEALFIVDFDEYGRPGNFFFPTGTSAAEKKPLMEMIFSIHPEFPRITPKDPKAYKVYEQNLTGEYRSNYNFKPKQCNLSKKRIEYIKMWNEKGFLDKQRSAKISQSKIQFTLDPVSAWIHGLSFQEKVQLSFGGRTMSQSNSLIKVQQLPFRPNQNLKIWQLNGGINQVLADFEKDESKNAVFWRQYQLDKRRKQLQDFDPNQWFLDQLLDNPKRRQKVSAREHLKASKLIANYLRAYPEYAEQLAALLKKEGIPNFLISQALNALALADNRESQNALIKIMEGDDQRRYTRIHATISTGNVATPIPELVESLWRATKEASAAQGSLEREQGRTSYFTLGRLEETRINLRTPPAEEIPEWFPEEDIWFDEDGDPLYPADSPEFSLGLFDSFITNCKADINQAMENKDYSLVAVILDGIYNSIREKKYDDVVFLNFLTPFLDLSHSGIQEAAVRVVSGFPANLSMPLIKTKIESGITGRVRLEALHQYKAMEDSEKDLFLIEVLKKDRNRLMRVEVVRLLGKSIQGDSAFGAEALQALQELRKVENDQFVIQEIEKVML